MSDTTTVWAVAAQVIYDGWHAGTVEQDGMTYADVYPTQLAAEKELADIIAERLRQFIDGDPGYKTLANAMHSGFSVVPAQMHSDGIVVLGDEQLGYAPPDVRTALQRPDHSRQPTT